MHEMAWLPRTFLLGLLLFPPAEATGAEIHLAAAALNVKRVDAVLQADAAAVNAVDTEGNTPLHIVANHIALTSTAGADKEPAVIEIIKLLEARGANESLRNRHGLTALQIALHTDSNGVTTLHLASRSGWINTVKALLTLGANPNQAIPANNMQPLLMASYGGHLEVVRLLLAQGADVNAATKTGSTALDAARERKHSEVEQEIMRHKIAHMQKQIEDSLEEADRMQRQFDRRFADLSKALHEAAARTKEADRVKEEAGPAPFEQELRCAAQIADAHFLYSGQLNSDRRRVLFDHQQEIALVLPFEEPSTPGLWYFFTPFGGYSHQFEYSNLPQASSSPQMRFTLSLPHSPPIQVEPFWNSTFATGDPWRDIALWELRSGDCKQCEEISGSAVPADTARKVLSSRLSERLDAYWKNEMEPSLGGRPLLDEVSDPHNRRKASDIRQSLSTCSVLPAPVGEKAKRMIDQIDSALARMPELRVSMPPKTLADSPRFVAELTCLSALARGGGEINSVGVGAAELDLYSEIILGKIDEPALLYPAEDSSSPGTWYFFTPWMSYRYNFKYPDIPFSLFEQRLKPLREQIEQLDRQAVASAKEERVDLDHALSEIEHLWEKLREAKADDATFQERLGAEITRLFASAPRTKTLVTKLCAAAQEIEAIRRDQPWGEEGTPLARYELELPGVPKVQVIPVITRNADPPFGDGVPWRSVALRQITGLECQAVCTTLQPNEAPDPRFRDILTNRILSVLDDYWTYTVLSTDKAPDGTIRKATRLDPARAREFSNLFGDPLRTCAATPGRVGEKARYYLSQFMDGLRSH